MHTPTPRDSNALRESFQALRLAVELLSNATDAREIPEILDLIIRVADRSLMAVERVLAESGNDPHAGSSPDDQGR